jgi:hypothetical protein
MCHKSLTFNISGNNVRLKPIVGTPYGSIRMELRIEGLTDDTLTLNYSNKEDLHQDMRALRNLFYKLYTLQPEAWGNSKGVMSRGEIRLMRLAIMLVGISVLTCLVFFVGFII